jgi:hypothetical protein
MRTRKPETIEDWLHEAEIASMRTAVNVGPPRGLKSGKAGELIPDVFNHYTGVLLALIEDLRDNGFDPKKCFEAGRLYGLMEAGIEKELLQEIATVLTARKHKRKSSRDSTDTDRRKFIEAALKLKDDPKVRQILDRKERRRTIIIRLMRSDIVKSLSRENFTQRTYENWLRGTEL